MNKIMIPKTIIHLLSGGLDSTVMLHDLRQQGHNVHCLLFDYKQRHAQELNFAKLHCRKMGVLYTVYDIPQLRGSELTDGSGGVVVKNRNAIFISLAVHLAAHAGADTVTYACTAEDQEGFPDCRQGFIDAQNASNKAAEINVEVCAPYITKRKSWIFKLGLNMGVDMAQTWSCYRGGAKPCGECPACKKLEAACGQ